MGGQQSQERNDRGFSSQTEEDRRRRRELFLEERFAHETPEEEEEEQKCYDPRDNTLKFVDEEDHLDFFCEEFESKRAAMSCGHAVTPMSLTQWCRRQLEEGKNKFVCGQPGCDAEWSYDEVRKMALLTSEEAKYFRTKLDGNIANSNPGHRQCPGCKSYVRRTDPNNLSLECPKCTAEKKRSYRFCWQCLKEWSGPAPRSDHCDNEDCVSPLEILKNCPEMVFKHLQGVTGCPSVRACPTCGLLVEHDGTHCNNITCCRCRVEFCFVCLKFPSVHLVLGPTERSNICSGQHVLSTTVAPRQTSIPEWNKK